MEGNLHVPMVYVKCGLQEAMIKPDVYGAEAGT